MEVMSEEECCTVFKPLPMTTDRDGQHYSPLQAAGHVLGLEKKTVDTAVTRVRTAASAVAGATLTAKSNLATALGGEDCCHSLPWFVLCVLSVSVRPSLCVCLSACVCVYCVCVCAGSWQSFFACCQVPLPCTASLERPQLPLCR